MGTCLCHSARMEIRGKPAFALLKSLLLQCGSSLELRPLGLLQALLPTGRYPFPSDHAALIDILQIGLVTIFVLFIFLFLHLNQSFLSLSSSQCFSRQLPYIYPFSTVSLQTRMGILWLSASHSILSCSETRHLFFY